MKSPDACSDFQRGEMHLLFEIEPKMKVAYGLLCALRNIFSKTNASKKAKKALHKWYKNVGKTRIKEIISVRDTIKSKEEYILNYFNRQCDQCICRVFQFKGEGLKSAGAWGQ